MFNSVLAYRNKCLEFKHDHTVHHPILFTSTYNLDKSAQLNAKLFITYHLVNNRLICIHQLFTHYLTHYFEFKKCELTEPVCRTNQDPYRSTMLNLATNQLPIIANAYC